MISSRAVLLHIRTTGWVLMVVIMGALFMTGCGSSSYSDSSKENYDMEMAQDEDASLQVSGDTDGSKDTASEDRETSEAAMDTSRKLITTMNVYAETEDFDELFNTINGKIVSLGGYIESSNLDNYNDGARTINMTVRIPAEELKDFIEEVDNNSNIRSKTEEVRDVTLTYVDLKSHVTVLETEEARLLELLEKAENMEDILAIEDKLADVRYQRESIASQLKVYDNQISYSTVMLTIDEVERTTPKVQESWTGKITSGFSENLYRVGRGLSDFFTSFIIALPIIIIWIVILLLIFIIIKIVVKVIFKKKSKRELKAEQKANKQKRDRSEVKENSTQHGDESKNK